LASEIENDTHFQTSKVEQAKIAELERGANLKVFGEILPFLLRQAFTTDF
jgi:hypothetical protein